MPRRSSPRWAGRAAPRLLGPTASIRARRPADAALAPAQQVLDAWARSGALPPEVLEGARQKYRGLHVAMLQVGRAEQIEEAPALPAAMGPHESCGSAQKKVAQIAMRDRAQVPGVLHPAAVALGRRSTGGPRRAAGGKLAARAGG